MTNNAYEPEIRSECAAADALPRPRHRWPKVLLALASCLLSLKVSDFLLGLGMSTQERHFWRMPIDLETRHTSSEFDYALTTNALGLRGGTMDWAKPAGTRRVVLVGDSFVAGWGVALQDMLSTQLQSRLNSVEKVPGATAANGTAQNAPGNAAANAKVPTSPKTEVIPLGRVGSGTIREADLFEHLGWRFSPDVVVLVYFLGNDLRETHTEIPREAGQTVTPTSFGRRVAYTLMPNAYLELAMWRQAQENNQRLGRRTAADLEAQVAALAEAHGGDGNRAVERYRQFPAEVRQQLEAGQLSDHRVLPACDQPRFLAASIDPTNAELAEAWPKTEQALNRLRTRVQQTGAQFVVVIVPDAVQVSDAALEFARQVGYEVDPAWRTGTPSAEQALLNWAHAQGVEVLSLADAFRNAPEATYFVQDGHWNAAGNELAATVLAQYLTEKAP